MREPARSVHIVPDVKDSLLSTSKMVDADYIAVYDKEEVNFYDAKTTNIVITEEAVLTGYRCLKVGCWDNPDDSTVLPISRYRRSKALLLLLSTGVAAHLR